MCVCFLCGTELYGERTQVCSSFTPHSNVSYLEKIVELMGDEFVVFVTPEDFMCKNYCQGTFKDRGTTTVSYCNYCCRSYGSPNSIKILYSHQQPQYHQQQQQQQQQLPTQQESTNKIKIYQCGFCAFQSKELGHVRFHMRKHMNKKDPEIPILTQAAKALTPKRHYRCQLCSKSFDSPINCLDHIQKDHYQPTPSTSNGERETKHSCPVTTKVMKPKPSKTQENNQEAEFLMDIDENQQENNKGTDDIDIMLNDNVPTEGSANFEQEEGTENAGEGEETKISMEDKTGKEVKLKKNLSLH